MYVPNSSLECFRLTPLTRLMVSKFYPFKNGINMWPNKLGSELSRSFAGLEIRCGGGREHTGRASLLLSTSPSTRCSSRRRDEEMGKQVAVFVVAVLALCLADRARSDASDHRYKEGDAVPLYANKVGPFHNPR